MIKFIGAVKIKKRFGFIKCVDKVDAGDREAVVWNTNPLSY